MRLGLFRLALLVFSFAMTLAVGELFVRIAAPQPVSWLAIYRSHPGLPIFSMLPNKTLHVDTGETAWTVVTDDAGFRTSEKRSQDFECNALWLGDSFAFGHGVEFEESFIGRIEQMNPSIRHINTSVPGYGPVQYRQILEYVDGEGGLDFDWIFVTSYVGNDFHDTQWDKNAIATDGILGNEGDIKSFLKRNFHIFRLVSATYHILADGDQGANSSLIEDLARPTAWDEDFLSIASQKFATEMERIEEYATHRGKPVVFLTIPTREAAEEIFRRRGEVSGSARNADSDARQPTLPVMRALAIFEEIGARSIDLTPILGAFPAEEMFFRFDGHLTPKANQLVADEFVRRVALECEAPGDGLQPPTVSGAGRGGG